MLEKKYDFKNNGWFIPNVKDDLQAEAVKNSVLIFLKQQYPDIQETNKSSIAFGSKGDRIDISIGDVLTFKKGGPQPGKLWAILQAGSLYLLVCTHRGAFDDCPIMVGSHEVLYIK